MSWELEELHPCGRLVLYEGEVWQVRTADACWGRNPRYGILNIKNDIIKCGLTDKDLEPIWCGSCRYKEVLYERIACGLHLDRGIVAREKIGCWYYKKRERVVSRLERLLQEANK